MYYSLIILSVIMFGFCFSLQDKYRRMRGSDFLISLEMSLIGSAAGLIVLLAMNGFLLEFTLFTFCIAMFTALTSVMMAYCTFRALDTIDLSMYSLFSMLGGMVLPFLQGILFYNEKLTVAKSVCLICVFASLLLTVSPTEKKKGSIYYVGVFVLNGMSGVLSKIFTSSSFEKTSAAGYSILASFSTVLLAGILLLCMKSNREKKPYSIHALGVCSLNGILNRLANFLLVIALLHVEASVQYPLVTGGVIIVSTIFSYFTPNKPSKKVLAAVVISFIGILLLVTIPC